MWNIIIIRITSASLIRLGLFRCLFPSETAFFDSIFENSLQKSSITQKISVILHSLSTCIVLRFLVVLCLSFNYKSTQTSAPVQVFLVLCCCISAYFLYRTHVNYVLWASITTAVAAVFCYWFGVRKKKESDDWQVISYWFCQFSPRKGDLNIFCGLVEHRADARCT